METSEKIPAQIARAKAWLEGELLTGRYFGTTFLTWLAVQLAIVASCFILARFISRSLKGPLEERLSEIEDNRRLLRLLSGR